MFAAPITIVLFVSAAICCIFCRDTRHMLHQTHLHPHRALCLCTVSELIGAQRRLALSLVCSGGRQDSLAVRCHGRVCWQGRWDEAEAFTQISAFTLRPRNYEFAPKARGLISARKVTMLSMNLTPSLENEFARKGYHWTIDVLIEWTINSVMEDH